MLRRKTQTILEVLHLPLGREVALNQSPEDFSLYDLKIGTHAVRG